MVKLEEEPSHVSKYWPGPNKEDALRVKQLLYFYIFIFFMCVNLKTCASHPLRATRKRSSCGSSRCSEGRASHRGTRCIFSCPYTFQRRSRPSRRSSCTRHQNAPVRWLLRRKESKVVLFKNKNISFALIYIFISTMVEMTSCNVRDNSHRKSSPTEQLLSVLWTISPLSAHCLGFKGCNLIVWVQFHHPCF